jgi:outer membrane receptor protein involved in Fe transport
VCALALSSGALLALPVAPARAQEPAAPAEQAASTPPPPAMEELIVTSTKREASVQDIPIAVSAFGEEELEARGIADLSDLQQISPSISVYGSNSTVNGGTLRIRGMGTTGNNPGLEAAVGAFVDGVYRSRSGQAFNDFLDVERIEILRGPQGTLFGKNTSAGAVHIITQKPSMDWGAHASVSYGNYDYKKATGSVTGPIVEDLLAFRVAGSWADREGYYEIFNDSDAFSELDRYSLRGQLLFTPVEEFEARLIVDYTKKEESCCPAGIEAVDVRSGLAVALLGGSVDLDRRGRVVSAHNRKEREVGVNYDPKERVEDWGASLEMNWDMFENTTITSITAYRQFHDFYSEDVDFTDADILRPQNAFDDFETLSQELRAQGTAFDDLLDWLVGVYAYREEIGTGDSVRFGTQGGAFVSMLATWVSATDTPGSPTALAGLFPTDAGYRARWSQETEGWAIFTDNTFNLTESLHLTLGARYSHEIKEAEGIINGARPGTSVNDPTPTQFPPLVPLGLNWCESLNFVAGGFFRDSRPFGAAGGLQALCDNPSWKNDATEREWTYTGKLAYDLTDETIVYVSYSRGYKAGGFNLDQDSYDLIVGPGGTTSFTPCSATLTNTCLLDSTRFDPEFSDAYELGLKTTLLDGRLRLNIAGFYTEFEDFQLNTFTGLGFVISNVDEVESRGGELEMLFEAAEGVLLNLGVTYADTRYGDNVDLVFGHNYPQAGPVPVVPLPPGSDNPFDGIDPPLDCNNPPPGGVFDPRTCVNVDGERITHAPAWQGAIGLMIEQPIPGTELMWFWNTNAAYRGRHNTGSNLHPLKEQSAYWVLGAQIGLRPADANWEVRFWGTNLTNEIVKTIVFDSVFQTGGQSAFYNEPRMFGVTLSYNY